MSAPKGVSAAKPAKVTTKTAVRCATQAREKRARPGALEGATDKSEASQTAFALAAAIEHALARGESGVLTPEALQALIAAVCRSYAAEVEAGANFPPLAQRNRVTSTDVMVTASGLLKSANLAVFELGMWQSWTGR
jgi:hypothetical protein